MDIIQKISQLTEVKNILKTVTLEITVDTFFNAKGKDIAAIREVLSKIGEDAAKNNSSVWKSLPIEKDLISAVRFDIKTSTKES